MAIKYTDVTGPLDVPVGSIDLGATATSLFDSAKNFGSDFASKTWDNLTDTSFLASAGISLLAAGLAKKVERPSLTFGSLAATTQVALGVGAALKAGASTLNEIRNAERGIGAASNLQLKQVNLIDKSSDIDSQINKKASDSIEFIRYPTDLASSYSMALTFYEYERFSMYQESTVKARDVIRLPLPANLVDVISLQYNNLQMGPLRGPFLENLSRFARDFDNAESLEQLGNLVGREGRNIAEKVLTPEVGRLVGRSVLQRVSPSTASALDLALGNTPNPHATITFNGVNLRAFQFNWRLSPNNLKDSEELKRLIFVLKSKSLPRKDSEFLLKYPDYVKLKLFPSTLHELFNFRTMVLDTFTVNYAPSGNLAFHSDDTPVEVEISMSLREVDIQTSEDYDSLRTKYSINQAEISGE